MVGLFYKKNQITKNVLYRKMVLQGVTCYSLLQPVTASPPSLPEGDILHFWGGLGNPPEYP